MVTRRSFDQLSFASGVLIFRLKRTHINAWTACRFNVLLTKKDGEKSSKMANDIMMENDFKKA